MKKVLALVMVLGMAGFASAGLQYQIDGVNYDAGAVVDIKTPSVTVALFNTAQQAAAFEIGGVALNGDAMYVGTGVVVAENLPGSWSTVDYGFNDGYGFVIGINYDAPSTNPTKAGKLFEFTFDFSKPVDLKPTATFGLLDGNWGSLGQIRVNLIPEPMTLSLLGLGALVLRRRS